MDLADLIARNAALHARQGGVAVCRQAVELCRARGSGSRLRRARAQNRARRRARRPPGDPRRQSSRLSRAALCLRPARRHAGAVELAARGARAALHPRRCLGEGPGRDRTRSPPWCRRCAQRSPIFASSAWTTGRTRDTFDVLLAAGRGDDRNPHIDSRARCSWSTPRGRPGGRRARCCVRRRCCGTP